MAETQIPSELQGPFGTALPGCYRFTPPGFDGVDGKPRVHWWIYVPRTQVDAAFRDAQELIEWWAKAADEHMARVVAYQAAPADAKPERPTDPRGEGFRKTHAVIQRWCRGVTVGEAFLQNVEYALTLIPEAALTGVVGAIANAEMADDLYPKS